MHTEALRGLDYGDVPWGTSSKDRPKGNEGRRLKANRYQVISEIGASCIQISCMDRYRSSLTETL